MQVWVRACLGSDQRQTLCERSVDDEGSQWPFMSMHNMIYLAGSRNRKTRRTARVLEEDKGSSHANQG